MSEPARESADDAAVTCAGCRQQGTRSDLERFVYHDDLGVCYDMRGGAPGREAWVHPLYGCLRAACWAGFPRAFREPLDSLDPRVLGEELEQGLHRRLRERLTDAARLGEAAVGRSAVERELGAEELEIVVVDCEASEETTDSFGDAPDEVFVVDEIRPGTLREAFGSDVGAVGVFLGDRAVEIGRIGEKLICLAMDDATPA